MKIQIDGDPAEVFSKADEIGDLVKAQLTAKVPLSDLLTAAYPRELVIQSEAASAAHHRALKAQIKGLLNATIDE